MHHTENENAIPAHQCGACCGKDATTAIMHLITLLDIICQQNDRIAVVSNDAIDCHDRTIAIFAGKICLKLKMNLGQFLVILSLLLNHCHHDHAAHGTSSTPYSSNETIFSMAYFKEKDTFQLSSNS